MTNKPQSEAPSVDELDEILVNLLLGKNFTSEIENWQAQADNKAIQQSKAKINRLIAGAEENGILKGLYQARYATEPGSEEEQRIDNQIAELSNNLSKGDGK